MLSSVSYVCLGVCAGMWVIIRGIYLGVLVWSFISVLLFQRSGPFDLFLTFQGVCVVFLLIFCRCFQLYYVVGSSGCGSPGIQCFTIPCKFSSGCCVCQQSTQYFLQVFFFLQQIEVLGTRTWLDSFSPFSVSLCYLFASFNDRGEDNIAWFHQLGSERSPSDHPLVKITLAGAQRLLAHQTTKKEPITVSVRAVSCLQGGLNGLFV